MRPLRIVFVTRRYWPLASGPATVTAQLAGALAAQGHKATIVTPRWSKAWPDLLTHQGAGVVRLPISTRLWANFQFARTLAHWLREHAEDIDLVYVWGLKHDAAAAVAACREAKIPVVLRPECAGLAGDCHWQIDARFGRRIKYRCMEAAAIVVTSPTLRDEVIAAGFPRDRIQPLPPGTLAPQHEDGDKARSRQILGECHRSFQVPAGAPVALCLGRFDETKDLPLLVQSWAAVVREFSEARLWLVGDGPLAPDLFALGDALDLRERLVIAGPFDCTQELFAAADVYIAPTSDAGTSMGLLEAMAAGMAICATDIPDHRHFLAGGECGILVQRESAATMAAGVLTLLRDAEQSRQFGRAANARARSDFPLTASVDAHLKLFRDLVG